MGHGAQAWGTGMGHGAQVREDQLHSRHCWISLTRCVASDTVIPDLNGNWGKGRWCNKKLPRRKDGKIE